MADGAREEVVGGGTGLAMVAKGKGKKGRGTSESTERKFFVFFSCYKQLNLSTNEVYCLYSFGTVREPFALFLQLSCISISFWCFGYNFIFIFHTFSNFHMR